MQSPPPTYPPSPPIYPRPYPPQQQPFLSGWQLVLLVSGVTIIFMSLCGGSVALLNALITATSRTQTITVQVPVDATATPFSGSNVFPAPTLGSTPDDFLRAPAPYQLVPGSRGMSFTTIVEGYPVQINLTAADPTASPDGVAHVAIINVTLPANELGAITWSPAAANVIAWALVPLDAHRVRTQQTPQGGSVEHIFQSDRLASAFNATEFTNDAGTLTVAPGTLYYVCQRLYATSGDGVDSCTISIGVA